MALLAVANLELAIGQRRLLDGVNLTLHAGQHVGLVGRNGCGKSCLLKTIAGVGEFPPLGGQIQVARDCTIGYLTQDPQLAPNHTLREEAATVFADLAQCYRQLTELSHQMAEAREQELPLLLRRYEHLERRINTAGGFALDHRIDATLHGLGLTDEFFPVKVSGLSGGQRGRLALAKLLLAQPDLLLLDEPTNHLDLQGREWLEQFLAQYRGAVILVSHDRWLLDRVVSSILELEQGKLVEYPGNYSKYRELRDERKKAQLRVYEKQQQTIRREQQFIDRYRASQRARQARGREKRLERYVHSESVDRPQELGEINIRFQPKARSGDLVLSADGLAKSYKSLDLFRDVSLIIQRGDRLGIIGPNGAGKSTLVGCLLGEQPGDRGLTRLGSQVHVGFYRQVQDHLDKSQTVVDYLRQHVLNQTEQEARDLAGAFLFSGQDQDKLLGSLSGGELSRLALAGLIVGGHNLLVLDEPTNHLDLSSVERLEEALQQFTATASSEPAGTLIVISHDRMLLDHLVDQLLVFDGRGNVRHFLGNYSQYLEAQQASGPASHTQLVKEEVKRPKALIPKPRTARSSAITKLNQHALETRIMGIESQMAEIDRQLADPQTYRDGQQVKNLQDQRDMLQQELMPLEEEWLRRTES